MENFLELLLPIAGFVVIVGIFGFMLAAVSRDAVRRGKSPALVIIAVFFFFPWGLIAWLAFRPDPIDPPGGDFDLRDFRSQ